MRSGVRFLWGVVIERTVFLRVENDRGDDRGVTDDTAGTDRGYAKASVVGSSVSANCAVRSDQYANVTVE